MTHTWVSFPCLLYFIFCKARIFGVLWIRKHLFFPCHSDPSSTTPWIFRARQYPSYTKLRWLRKFPKRHIHLRVRNTFWWWHPNPIFWVTPRIFFVASRELQKSLEKRQDTCHLSELRETYGLMFDTSSIPQNLILNIPIFVVFQQEVPFVFIEL